VTGPIKGKLEIDANVYFLSKDGEVKLEGVSVYVHVKGYARAKVTHLDVEDGVVKRLIYRGRGNFLDIRGVEGGIIIQAKIEREMEVAGKSLRVWGLRVVNSDLNTILAVGEMTRTWVGRKYDGLYIGFRKNEVLKLEKMALEKFGLKPLGHLEESPFDVVG